ncbi:MAG: hypothetical protein QOE61_1429 [Micromonosporaceae bacterium]|nr:hypothetical protein [Micromonosporaceae bacterium]
MPTTSEPQPLPGAAAERLDLAAAAAMVAAVAGAAAPERVAAHASVSDLLDALGLLRWMRDELAVVEPALIAAARHAGVSWQTLAPALGVASRQAAERRYLRLVPAQPDQASDTRDSRVRAERDRRAGHRAVAQWANDNTADLRRLVGQITALADLDDDSAAHIDRLHHALADPDAAALPLLLAGTQRYLHRHPELAGQIDSITAHTEQVRRQTQQRRDGPVL